MKLTEQPVLTRAFVTKVDTGFVNKKCYNEGIERGLNRVCDLIFGPWLRWGGLTGQCAVAPALQTYRVQFGLLSEQHDGSRMLFARYRVWLVVERHAQLQFCSAEQGEIR